MNTSADIGAACVRVYTSPPTIHLTAIEDKVLLTEFQYRYVDDPERAFVHIYTHATHIPNTREWTRLCVATYAHTLL